MQLLKPWPMVSQARLLFIFYGPLTPEGEAAFWCSVKLFLLLLAFSRLGLTLNKNVAIGILAVKRNLRNRAHLNATKSLWWKTDRQTDSQWVSGTPSLCAGTLAWEDVVDRGLTVQALCDLARAFLLLFCKRDYKVWTTNSMLAILEELIGINISWLYVSKLQAMIIIQMYTSQLDWLKSRR